MAVPVLTHEQRIAASAKAVEIRVRRAQVKQQLKDRALTFSDLVKVSDQDEIISGMKVISVLEALPAFGKVKATSLMEKCGIAPSRRMKGLGQHQAQALLDALAKRASLTKPSTLQKIQL
jgi:hypothetical protein